MKFAVGRRYRTRSGAIATVVYIHDVPIHAHGRACAEPCRMATHWRYVVAVVEGDPDIKVSLCPDGRYRLGDEDDPNDLVEEIAETEQVAA